MKKYILNDDIKNNLRDDTGTCVDCKLCMENCPMLDHFCESPKELMENLVNDNSYSFELPFSCTLCNYCTTVCPKDISLKDSFYEMRKNVVEANNGLPIKSSNIVIKVHQSSSFSKTFSTSIMKNKKDDTNILFFPGCSLSSYNPDLVNNVFNYLCDKIPNISIIQHCCGNPTHSMGQINEFEDKYAKLTKYLENHNVKEVIVACQNCYKTISANSNIKVSSVYDVIAEYGIPEKLRNYFNNSKYTFTIHDPCATRDNSAVHNSVREISKDLGLRINEMKFNKERTLCCGSGGMLGVTNNTLALEQSKKRVNQSNADCIISYCQECVESMKRGGSKSLHILDLLFNNDILKSFNQKEISFSQKWKNRRKAKLMIDKINVKHQLMRKKK